MATKAPINRGLPITPEQVGSLALPLRNIRIDTFQKMCLVVQPMLSLAGVGKFELVWEDVKFKDCISFDLTMTAPECLSDMAADVTSFEANNDELLWDYIEEHSPRSRQLHGGTVQNLFEAARKVLEADGYPVQTVFGSKEAVQDLKVSNKFFPSYERGPNKRSLFIVAADRTRTGVMHTSPMEVEVTGQRSGIPKRPHTGTLELQRSATFLLDPKAFVFCDAQTMKGEPE